MEDALVIPRRFRGPDDSGNGGWTCGAVSRFVVGQAEVTLRRPPPLDRGLRVADGGDHVAVFDGDDLVAEATTIDREVHWAPFVDPAEADAAGERYLGHLDHAFPNCFTCGPARDEGDGLRIFPGPVDGRPELVADTWTPDASLLVDGELGDPIVWAALDCPSVWAHLADGTAAVLGRMTADVRRRPEVGQTYVVVGEASGSEGRKRFGSAAIYTPEGEPIAASNATWITIDR